MSGAVWCRPVEVERRVRGCEPYRFTQRPAPTYKSAVQSHIVEGVQVSGCQRSVR